MTVGPTYSCALVHPVLNKDCLHVLCELARRLCPLLRKRGKFKEHLQICAMCFFPQKARVFVFFCSIESCTEGHTEKPNQISQTISVPEEKVWTGDCFAR